MNNNTNWLELVEMAKSAGKFTPPVPKPTKSSKPKEEVTGPTHDGKMDTLDAVAIDFAMGARNEVRYLADSGKWLIWNKYKWEVDTTGRVKEIVKELGRDYKNYKLEEYRPWGKKLLNAGGIRQLLDMACTDPRLVVTSKQFDTETYELNTPGGIVDLYTGTIRPATPNDLIKRSTTVTPDASVPTPKYDTFMAQTFAGEPELTEYIQTLLGITLVKSQDEQIFVYMFGESGAGKGTLMNLAGDILGKNEDGYVAAIDSSMFIQSNNQPHPTEYMQFLGARMAISSEISQGQKMDTGKLKKTTGGDPITGRHMGKDFVTFDATHTLWLMANDKLQVPHGDKGVWRRLRVVPFKHAKKSDEYTKSLPKILLEEEGPGILAKWIESARKALTEGFSTPDSVVQANNEYINEQDTVAQWLASRCFTNDPTIFTVGKALRDSYVSWCKQESKTHLGDRAFSLALKEKGFIDSKPYINGKQYRGFLGIEIEGNVDSNTYLRQS